MPYGYDDRLWDKAKNEAYVVFRDRVSRRYSQTIAYSELAAAIRSIRFDVRSNPFHELLGQISTEEDEAGRGMLSVLVIHKPPGDMMPGPVFFELAEYLGRDVGDPVEFWAKEFKFVTKSQTS